MRLLKFRKLNILNWTRQQTTGLKLDSKERHRTQKKMIGLQNPNTTRGQAQVNQSELR